MQGGPALDSLTPYRAENPPPRGQMDGLRARACGRPGGGPPRAGGGRPQHVLGGPHSPAPCAAPPPLGPRVATPVAGGGDAGRAK
eukprot:scaffold1414_cov384-Prasinococcus_capsulatus_cf.AAC.24